MIFYDKQGSRLARVPFGICASQSLNLKDIECCPDKNFDDDGEFCVPDLCEFYNQNAEVVDGDLFR